VKQLPLFFALAADEAFAAQLAAAAGGEIGRLTSRSFPDGETYLRLDTDPASRDVVIVGSLHRPNETVLPLVLLADAARQLGAARVGLVAPYLAYMRQDARFQSGEAITAKSFAALLSRAVDWLLTVDPHLHRVLHLSDIYTIPAEAVHATTQLGNWIKDNVRSPVLVGPDEESRQWVSAVAGAANAPFLVLVKTRQGDADVSVTVPPMLEYAGRTPVLIDDIISTGQTMAAAARQIRAAGGGAPICVGVHAVFAPGAEAVLREAGVAQIVTTNSIVHASNQIDIIPALAGALRARCETET
jgi:ribose-phosphate pyrophosphokinase